MVYTKIRQLKFVNAIKEQIVHVTLAGKLCVSELFPVGNNPAKQFVTHSGLVRKEAQRHQAKGPLKYHRNRKNFAQRKTNKTPDAPQFKPEFSQNIFASKVAINQTDISCTLRST